MKEKIVCVEWDDASFNSGYYDERKPENFEPVLTRTVGFMIKTTSKAIILGIEKSDNREGQPPDDRHITTIPKKMVTKITELRE